MTENEIYIKLLEQNLAAQIITSLRLSAQAEFLNTELTSLEKQKQN